MVTIKEISNRLGISISSVSKALNGATDISKETRDKVLEVANELGYIKKSVSNKKNLKLGIIIDQNCDEYNKVLNYDVIRGFTNEALEDGNIPSLVSLKDISKKSCLEIAVRTNNLSGGVILLHTISDSIRRSILKLSHPIVMLNNNFGLDKQNIGYVDVNMVESMKKVVKHFIDRSHRDICFININGHENSYQDKLVGYIAALTSFSINYNPDNVLNIKGDIYKDEVLSFISRRNPKAICCDSDLTAYRVLNILRDNGYNVPEDISIVGFDNSLISSSCIPSLSTVSYDRYELGVKAYVILKNLLNGNNISRMQIKSDIIERESSR